MSESEDDDRAYTDAEQAIIDRTAAHKDEVSDMSAAEAREWAEDHSYHLLAQARKVGDLNDENRPK